MNNQLIFRLFRGKILHIMERVLEPELMDDLAGAEAYANSDWTIPHNAFVARFKQLFPDFSQGLVVDLGCGTADPAIRFAKHGFANLRG